jgi:hypothetical protein
VKRSVSRMLEVGATGIEEEEEEGEKDEEEDELL